MDESLSLQEYLKLLRKEKGYTQEFIAENLSITRQTYSHYETGRIIPPTNSLYNLARLYGEPIENFLEKAVTYRIGGDLKLSGRYQSDIASDEIDYYRKFIESAEYKNKCKALDQNERLLLYYYSHLDEHDKQNILSFMKAMIQNDH